MATNYEVVQAQRDFADAQNNELRALLNYRKALVNFETVQTRRHARRRRGVGGGDRRRRPAATGDRRHGRTTAAPAARRRPARTASGGLS